MEKEPSEPTTPDVAEIWEALARHLAGESSPEESARVRAWVAEDTDRAALVNVLGRSMDRLAAGRVADVDVEAALQRVKGRRFEQPETREWRRSLMRVAAVVTLVLGASLIWRSANDEAGRGAAIASTQTYQTRVGQTDTVGLADGTSVILGPDSRLALSAGYGATTRNVELSGQALFDVEHDPSRPFSVTSGAAVIREIGTRFLVRGGRGEVIRVAVTEGKVMLNATNADGKHGLVLEAGERGELTPNGRVAAIAGGVTDAELAWTQGRIVFENASLEQVATELRRWYGIDLRIGDASLTKRHVTGAFKGESAQQVLDVIGLALGATIERNGNTAILHANP